MDNYFTGSKDNLKQWIGHPRFELIRHGTHCLQFISLVYIPYEGCGPLTFVKAIEVLLFWLNLYYNSLQATPMSIFLVNNSMGMSFT